MKVPDHAIAREAGCSVAMVRSVRIRYRDPSPDLARRLLAVNASGIAERVNPRLATDAPRWTQVEVPIGADALETLAALKAEPVTVYPPQDVGRACNTCDGVLRRVDIPHHLRDSEAVERVGGWCDACKFGWIITTTRVPWTRYRGEVRLPVSVRFTGFSGGHLDRLYEAGVVP